MSLKQDIEGVKEQISSEEKMLEGMLKAEGFYKKYKSFIFGFVALILIVVVAIYTMSYLEEKSLEEANVAYSKLISNKGGDAELKTLEQKNRNLYEVYLFQKATQSGNTEDIKKLNLSNFAFLKDLSSYQIASLDKNQQELQNYSNGGELSELAIMQEAYLLIKDGKKDEANMALSKIPFNSQMANNANMLKHFLIKAD